MFSVFSKAPLVLASASPRRAHLLHQMGVPFEVIPAQVTEHEQPESCPRLTVEHNALLKARWVAERYPDRWVLGADTVVALNERVLHKPGDLAEARLMLQSLSGRTHTVYTGVALLCLAQCFEWVRPVSSEVAFKALDEALIDAYFAQVNPLDKAGAYGIQQGREMIIAGVEGSVNNVMGLPTETLHQQFESLAQGPR